MLVLLCTLLISCTTLFNRHVLKNSKYNFNNFILLVEFLKCLLTIAILKINFKESNIIPTTIEKQYFGIAFLYFLSNTLLLHILSLISSSSFMILNQHKIIWVFILSKIILKKKFTTQQTIACILNFIGTFVIFIDKSENNHDIDVISFILVVLHGLISSCASVYIEQVMSDGKILRVYFKQCLKLYLSGLPVYLLGALLTSSDKTLPSFNDIVPLTTLNVLQGLVIGAVFKFYGALVRSLIQNISIVVVLIGSFLIIDVNETISRVSQLAILLVIFSVFLFKKKN